MNGPLRTVVAIPTYNERAALPLTIERLLAVDAPFDVIVVDDNSPDGTGELADELAAAHDRIHVLHRPGKQGLGPAYLAAFRWAMDAGYDVVGEMDADLSHDPADLPRLLEAIQDADLVIGSRYVDGVRVLDWPLRRLLLSVAGNVYVRVLTGLPLSDATAGYRLLRTDMLRALDHEAIRADGYAFQVEVAVRAYRAGFAVVEIPVVFTERREGHSKMNNGIVREAVTRVLRMALEGDRRPPAAPHPASVRSHR